MIRSPLAISATACILVILAALPLAAQTAASPPADAKSSSAKADATTTPAEKCLSDLRTFDGQMEKDGYWLGGSGFGYGYPMGGYGYATGGYPEATVASYQNARPGYEIRVLIASASILGRSGQQQSCEDVLATTREVYKRYAAEMHSDGFPMADIPAWRRQEIAAAKPVTDGQNSFRSDELLGTSVRSSANEALGSVEDLVMSPKTGKIAYLVIGRGGVFGIDEKYVPVPWSAFKASANTSLLVLDTTSSAMESAPQVKKDQFASGSHFEQLSDKIDAYWKGKITHKGDN
jgi:sporulation protein YlmC with PRC-barrel domain